MFRPRNLVMPKLPASSQTHPRASGAPGRRGASGGVAGDSEARAAPRCPPGHIIAPAQRVPCVPVSSRLAEALTCEAARLSSGPRRRLCAGGFTRLGLLLLFSYSVVSDSVSPWTTARQASLSFTISWSLLKVMSVESVMMPSNHLILWSFPMSWLLPLGSQRIGASASVLPVNMQG